LFFHDPATPHIYTLSLHDALPIYPFNLSFSFESCILDHCSFAALKFKKIRFDHCHMHEVDFHESSFKEAIFNTCDLLRSQFSHTNLERADFSSAYNFLIDPEENQLKGAKFALDSLPALLTKYKVHIVA